VIVAPLLAAHERLWHLRANKPNRFAVAEAPADAAEAPAAIETAGSAQ
jgi:hypothetical protein